MTCLWCGVALKISWTSLRMSSNKNSVFESWMKRHTQSFKHLVTFVENKVLDRVQAQTLILDESQNASGSTDDDVRLLVLECFLIGLDGSTTVKDGRLDIWQVFWEAGVLLWIRTEWEDWTGEFTSFLIWKASSRVWQRITTAGSAAKFSDSICWSVARTKTAVLPIPDLAWQRTSIPRIAWGIHSCWTRIEN